MPTRLVTVGSEHGLHLRTAARIVRCAEGFRSEIVLRLGGRLASARNILGILTLCACMGAAISVEARGDDADDAVRAMEAVIAGDDGAPDPPQT